jgi:hypothetical protein
MIWRAPEVAAEVEVNGSHKANGTHEAPLANGWHGNGDVNEDAEEKLDPVSMQFC